VELLVVGLHMTGMLLNEELTTRGGQLLGAVRTSPGYRLFWLDTTPAKPGLMRATPDEGTAAGVAGELWALPQRGLASLLESLPSPMTLGRVALADGSNAIGFLCEPIALAGAQEITAYGGWREYLAKSRARDPPAGP
jgi:allophanate hydrolase